MVYVALSRVTTLEGLFITNKDGDFKFYNSKGKKNLDIATEYKRLENHKFNTIIDDCKKFLNISDKNLISLVLNK